MKRFKSKIYMFLNTYFHTQPLCVAHRSIQRIYKCHALGPLFIRSFAVDFLLFCFYSSKLKFSHFSFVSLWFLCSVLNVFFAEETQIINNKNESKEGNKFKTKRNYANWFWLTSFVSFWSFFGEIFSVCVFCC